VLWLPPGQTLNGPVCSFVFCAHYSAYVPTYYNVDDTVVVMLELRGHVLLDLMQARRSNGIQNGAARARRLHCCFLDCLQFVVNVPSRFMQAVNIKVLWSKHTDPQCTVNKLLVRVLCLVCVVLAVGCLGNFRLYRSVLVVVCCMLYAVRCWLHAVGCRLYAVCLYAVGCCCMLCAVCCTVYVYAEVVMCLPHGRT
jgi:hypothetical protein